MRSPGGSPTQPARPSGARVDVWSDIHCPWALLTVHRLREARQQHSLDVDFVPRAWPLEWVNRRGTPRSIVTAETAVLAELEPDLFTRFAGDSWPSTFLPAFELVAAARRAHGMRAAEDVDFALRLAFFRDSVDVSIRAGLHEALSIATDVNPDLDSAAIMRMWMDGESRADVGRDYETSKGVAIQGSPQIIWADGNTTHNPGMADHEWIDGRPHLRSVDAYAVERLLLSTMAPAEG